jgi:hypothetical protein
MDRVHWFEILLRILAGLFASSQQVFMDSTCQHSLLPSGAEQTRPAAPPRERAMPQALRLYTVTGRWSFSLLVPYNAFAL